MQSKAKTIKEYLSELPVERARTINKIRGLVKANLPAGYKEIMQYGMISYVVPLNTYPAGYLGQKNVALPYVSIASQKNHMAVYLLHIYADKKIEKWFFSEYKKSGKKLDIGKSCVRFNKLEDLPLGVIGRAVKMIPVKKLIEYYEKSSTARAKKGIK